MRHLDTEPQRRLGSPALIATIAVLLCAAYIAVNVIWNYGGNPTGPFFTGRDAPLPEQLRAERTWRVNDPQGYDGQFYHIIAHDPLMSRGFERYVDNARLRWRRIGVPGLAALTAAATRIDLHWAYLAIQLAFVYLGALWLARYASAAGRTPWYGLGFVAVPAVMVSLDRMTVDLALAALAVGFVWHARICDSPPGVRHRHLGCWATYGIMSVAPLVRESGMLLVAGWVAWNAVEHRWKRVVGGFLCALPALAWWTHVHLRTPPDVTAWLARYPFSGLIDRTLAGNSTPTTTAWLRVAGLTEDIALIGLWVAFGCILLLVWRRRFGLPEISAIAFAAFASLLGKYDIWDTAYAAGRTMSPLLVLLALVGIRDRQIVYMAPILMVLPRIALQFEAQLMAAVRAAVSGR